MERGRRQAPWPRALEAVRLLLIGSVLRRPAGPCKAYGRGRAGDQEGARIKRPAGGGSGCAQIRLRQAPRARSARRAGSGCPRHETRPSSARQGQRRVTASPSRSTSSRSGSPAAAAVARPARRAGFHNECPFLHARLPHTLAHQRSRQRALSSDSTRAVTGTGTAHYPLHAAPRLPRTPSSAGSAEMRGR